MDGSNWWGYSELGITGFPKLESSGLEIYCKVAKVARSVVACGKERNKVGA